MHKYLALFLIIGISNAGVLLTNGDFEQELTVGWFQVSAGGDVLINRATYYDSDPDYEAYVHKGTGSGYARLSQVVDIPTTDLEFSINAKLYAHDNNEDTLCWAGAAVIIAYLDESNSFLGCTQICTYTEPCPWENTTTVHLIDVSDTLWHNYAFNINDELSELPGINPLDIAKVAIALFDTTDHTC